MTAPAPETRVDFERINRAALAALPALLARWCPEGKWRGAEFVARNPRRADRHAGSFKVNRNGRWGDFAIGVSGGDMISLAAYLGGLGQVQAARELARAGDRTMTEGMFDPPPGGSKSAAPLRVVSEWQVIQPVPEDAPAAATKHPKLGAPSRNWPYLDAAGRLLGLVCRFDPKGAEKEIRSLVFAEHKKFGRQWRWLGFPKPRPLYGLDRLAARPAAPVVICEGEKAADAAGELLPDHVAITSPGGSKAARHADWSALAGRRITIWPDNDEAGRAYAATVAELLAKLSPVPALAVIVPPAAAEGWDAADAAAEGWTPARAAAPRATG